MAKILNLKNTKITFGAPLPTETKDEECRRICLQISAMTAIWMVKAHKHQGALVRLEDVVDELCRAMDIPLEEPKCRE